MGKGKKYADKACKKRYWAENRRRANKIRRVAACNGARFLQRWKAEHP
jgi:hypothetical protein